MKASLILSLFVCLLAYSAPAKAFDIVDQDEIGSEDAIGGQIDSRSFFDSIKGKYSILMAGGAVPHGNDVGTVELEDQVVLTFGYCPPGAGCDPGYIFLDYPTTKVFQNGQVYTITAVENGKATKYTWTVNGDKLSLRNFQYTMPNNSVVTLEHVLRRLAD